MAAVWLVAALPAVAHGKSDSWARAQFSAAARFRQTLDSQPPEERTRTEYQRAIDAYRRVYYGCPTSGKADASVSAVAELLLEMGRRFDDDKLLRSSIAEYEFLRREYPGSRYRFQALITIGEIYRDDLDDPARARATFSEFVRKYPHHPLADHASAALNEPVQRATLRKRDPLPPEDSPKLQRDPKKISLITSIRHWRTAESARVAIDLAQPVEFGSKRIENPDRVVLDLAGCRLDPPLAGKIFELQDGPLKKIRAAQVPGGKTRVVLEIQSSAEFKVFLLDDPPRLIVDVRNGEQPAEAVAARPVEAAPIPAKPRSEEIDRPAETPAKPSIRAIR